MLAFRSEIHNSCDRREENIKTNKHIFRYWSSESLSYKNTNIKLALSFSHRDLGLGAPNGIIWGKY